MAIPTEEARRALLRRILAAPLLVASEELHAAKAAHIVPEHADLPGLRAVNDAAFYRHMDKIPGMRGRDLCAAWWVRGVLPVLLELEKAHPESDL